MVGLQLNFFTSQLNVIQVEHKCRRLRNVGFISPYTTAVHAVEIEVVGGADDVVGEVQLDVQVAGADVGVDVTL